MKQSVTLFKLLHSLFERALTSGLIANLEESKDGKSALSRAALSPPVAYEREFPLYITLHFIIITLVGYNIIPINENRYCKYDLHESRVYTHFEM